ncbi:hypothetical protein Mgra_00007773 [Meloidogyne graminicola]|uniref:Uncharacterized protein n=1 Tax=Meloidogyne graminicola TaxID=189291 RepID=A0A8S9ZHY0_9BILA|nr:hypothetical protein Mgra_00007773 [Meloidogyne graminicola]
MIRTQIGICILKGYCIFKNLAINLIWWVTVFKE